jgi:seryl-tRNA synthetase
MIDLRLLEKDFDDVASRLKRKKIDDKLLGNIKNLFLENKKDKQILEALQATQNSLSRKFGEYKKENRDISSLKIDLDKNKILMQEASKNEQDSKQRLNSLSMHIPNFPDDSVPDGDSEDDNVEIKKVLEKPSFDFEPKEHWELAEVNGWIDFKRGVKLSKSRFSVLDDKAPALERALTNYMLDFNKKRGFRELSLPFVANRESLLATGQLPKFEDDLFKLEGDKECDINDLFLIPTAEVPLVNLYRDEILNESDLPLLVTSATQCFRKEAGSAGRDTRGIIREHQFTKVELVAFCEPDNSDDIFLDMVSCASDLLSSLGLHHRLVNLCTADLGFGASKTVDIEVWLSGQKEYREISSISNVRDFQARRAKIRYKKDKKNIFINTLNGSSLAVGRTIVAIMENYQNIDGTIKIPDVLHKYL